MGYDVRFYAEAETEIKRRRQNNAERTEERRRGFEKECPEYGELRIKLAGTGKKLYEIFTGSYEASGPKLAELERENLGLSARITELLIKHGKKTDWLDNMYSCGKCGDTGIYENRRCSCFMDCVKRLAGAEINKNAQIKLSRFESFDLNFYPDEVDRESGNNIKKIMTQNKEYCVKYAEDFRLPNNGIIMQGKTGLGKTHLSLAIANAVLMKGFSVVYGSAPDILRKMEREHFAGYNSDNDGKDTELIRTADLLILDDLGNEFESSFYVSAVNNLINARFNSGLPTVINTNLSPHEMNKRYSDRFTSRVMTMKQMFFYGSDIRVRKK